MADIRCRYCSKTRSGWLLTLIKARGFELEQEWLCSKPCLQAIVRSTVARSLDYLIPEVDYQHRVRIGSILVQRGIITPGELAEAVETQAQAGGTIGSHILRRGFCTEAELTAALSEQQGVPWVGVIESQIPDEINRLIPRQLCEDFSVFPFDFDRNEQAICVAARSPVKLALVHLLRKMLGLGIRAFIVTDGSFEQAMRDYLARRSPIGEVVIRCKRNSREITESLLAEAARVRARQIRLARYEEAFWVRLGKRSRWSNCLISLEKPVRVAGPGGQTLPKEESVAL